MLPPSWAFHRFESSSWELIRWGGAVVCVALICGCLLAEIGTKKEKISATKKLVVLSQGDVEDRPADARKLLGLGSGAVQLAASGCGGRDVFVQSTSGNRGLLAGSRMLFEVPFSPAGKKRKAVATGVTGSQSPGTKRAVPAGRGVPAPPGTMSSSSCTYRLFSIATPTTIQDAVEAAGVTYVRGNGFYRELRNLFCSRPVIQPALACA